MRNQTAFAWLVVLVAFVILAVALGPAIVSFATHGPHTAPNLLLLGIGIGLLFLGGLLLPGQRVAAALQQATTIVGQATTIVGPYLPFGRRAYDNPPPPRDPPADTP